MSVIGLSALLLALSPGGASATAAPPRPVVRATPVLSLCQAIERVETWAAAHGIDISSQFVREARLRSAPDDAASPCWEIVYQWASPRIGGELTALVRMDGSVAARPLGP